MSELYVVGGALRSSLFKQLEEWNSCKKALIVKVNPGAKGSGVMVEYDINWSALPEETLEVASWSRSTPVGTVRPYFTAAA